MAKLRLTERQLTNLIEDTVNEGILLTEKKVCGWGNGKFNKGGSKCTNRRMQKCWNCGDCDSYEDISPNEEMGCGGRTTSNGGGRGRGRTEKDNQEDLMENIIKKTLRGLYGV